MEESLPFLRPRSSRLAKGPTIDPRTAALRSLNMDKTNAKLRASHEESLRRSNRAHYLDLNSSGSAPRASFPPPRPPSSSTVTAPPRATASASSSSNFDKSRPSLQSDFDGLALSSHLERLIRGCRADSIPRAQDAVHAFEALDFLSQTLSVSNSPVAEILRNVKRILEPLVYRPGSSMQNDDDDDADDSSRTLLRDLVMGLEVEVDQLRQELSSTKHAHETLRATTARQVQEANSRRMSTDVVTAVHSLEVADATVARVQRESAEMATRLQHSLAQQQLVRQKLVDLGMRNMELRQVLEAQRRAATARSIDDVLPKAAPGLGGGAGEQSDSAAFGASGSANLDRSALHLMGDVVGSSQTELANLLEFRQRLSQTLHDYDM